MKQNKLLFFTQTCSVIKKKHFILFSLILLINSLINKNYSQNITTYTPKLSIPSSPEAALLSRFGDIPIGYYTGTTEISVPLYSINEGGIQIPITLNYHSSGIKVADEATWVGLGWDLSPEGTISVEVRGEIDASKNQEYYCANDPEAIQFKNRFLLIGDYYHLLQKGRRLSSTSCNNGSSSNSDEDPYCILTDLLAGKRQPDIYSYNFGGYSGRFYINPDTKKVILMDNKKEDIFFDVSYTGITARTIDGTIFYFNVLEDSHAGGALSDISGFTYKLNQIDLPNNKQINFSYTNEQAISFFYSESVDINGSINTSIMQNTSFVICNKKTLTKITTPTTIINFNLEDRDDISSSNGVKIKRLQSIDILSSVSNKKIKSYNFNYSYFNNNTIGYNPSVNTPEASKRLKLDSLKEIGYDINGTLDTSSPDYKFNYKTDVIMPQKNSFAVDIWGYYNGQNNSVLVPNLDYFQYPLEPRFSITNKPYFTYPYYGAIRYTDNAYAGANMLNKISYPTGGYTEFEYEPNTFTNQFIPTVDQFLSTRKSFICRIDNSFTNPQDFSKIFTISKNTTLKIKSSITHGFPNKNPQNPNANTSNIIYDIWYNSKVELRKTLNGSTTVIKSWDPKYSITLQAFTTSGAQSWDEDITLIYEPGATYNLSVYFPKVEYTYSNYYISQTYSNVIYSDDSSINKTLSTQCGFRIKSLKNYSQTGILENHKQINYYDGKLLNKFDPLTSININNKTSGGVSGGIPYEYIGFHKRISLSTDDFGINGGNLIGYGKVEEVEINTNTPSNNIGKKTFYYNNVPNKTKTGLPNIPNLKNGLINNEEYYNHAGDTLFKKKYYYKNLISPSINFNGIKMVLKSYGSTVPCGDTYQQGNYITAYYNDNILSGTQYQYNVYPINAEWNLLEQTISKQYFNNKILTTIEDYTYNSQGKIRTTSTNNSKGETIKTNYYYANDYPTQLPIEHTMVTNQMTGIPLVTENRKNNELLYKQNIQYTKDISTNNLILPKYILSEKGNGSNNITSEKKVSYNKYDDKGNIQQYTIENSSPVTILWGYNQTQPIAKIENISYANIPAGLITTAQDASNTGTETALIDALNALRIALPNAMVTTYTYIPLVGVSTITDPKGDTITYSYDNFGRLQFVKDKDKNILSENQYHYKQ
ncbi:RHS repeat protein [Flavobacterium sp. F-65]|uniref:RHS repeat protein n=1 Tax=Flavobacterium pisciphilum TaxID=2893755 RepID=A0ABS8MPP5_9FLAO|nr:RHS repeat protein [Flavobacterium sp. F-65]MCC9070720.1 RHS repeat protein [Flavobacterium sp. F-65]